jgi:hypothetical protein
MFITNQKKVYKFLILLLIFTFVFSSISYASESNVIELDTAKKLALANSRQLRSTSLASDKLNVYADQAKEAYNDLLYSSYNTLLNEYLILKKKQAEGDSSVAARLATLEVQMDMLKGSNDASTVAELYDKYRDAEDAYDDASQATKDFEQQLNYIVESQYMLILKQEALLKLLEKTYDLQSKQLYIERIKKDLGMNIEINISKLAVDVSNLYNQIKEQKNLLKVLKWKFNDMLGRQYNEEVNLVKVNVNIDYIIPNYSELLDKLTNNYSKIEQLKRDIEKKNDDLDDENIIDDDNKKKLVKIEIQEKELDLEREEFNLKTVAQDLINKLSSKQKLYQLAKISFNTAKQTYEWDKKKYELGMISKLQLDTSEMAYLEAANKKEAAGYDYFLAKHEIELAEQGILLSANSTEL